MSVIESFLNICHVLILSFTVSLMSVFCCRGKGKVDGVQTDDDEIRSDLETIQPALIDTQARRIRRRGKLFLALKGYGTFYLSKQ